MRIPYPTIVVLEQALAVVRDLGSGARIDRVELLERGLPPNAVGPAIDALVFAGVLDEAQRITGAGARFGEEPERLAREALAPVLERLHPPYPDRKTLAESLGRVSVMTLTTLPLAATFLVWLSERAGVDLVVRTRAKPGARPGVRRGSGARSGAAGALASAHPRPLPVSLPGSADPGRSEPAVAAGVMEARDAMEARTVPPDAARAARSSPVGAGSEGRVPHEARRPWASGPGPRAAPSLAASPAVPVCFQLVVDRQTTTEDLDRMVSEVRGALDKLRDDKPSPA